MKNQYFGDINDYRKYGLLRSLIHATGLRLLVAWMLTPDDGSTDGKFTSYLHDHYRWIGHDRALFSELANLMADGQQRRVSLIENTDLLPNTKYYSDITPDQGTERQKWFSSLVDRAKGVDIVFLDPDNGLEVKSTPYGRRRSSKFLYWREVEALWSSGKSLLIYQHFIREKRPRFIERMLTALRSAASDSYVEAFSTANVVFLMALQPDHHYVHSPIVDLVQKNWAGQITHWELGGS